MLRLHNTMTRSADEFEPIEPGKVRLYTCGPTVYNYAHIGNLRTYIFEDILKRVLRLCGYDVKHVMNVTDVGHLVSDADEGEDKMIVAMRREGKSIHEIAAFYWDAFRLDMARLHLIEPDVWCKATDHIDEQKAQVEILAAKGYTYVIDDGIYFDTSKLPDYGKLARLDVEGLRAGHRVEVVKGKRNATDFAVWKFSSKDTQRLMEWDNPCEAAGKGFPGWHIECSAMSMKYLGDRLDIHCGAIDLVPVHHTNEIAQAEAALGHEWCNWWSHGEFLTLPKGDGTGGRMSKSSGEFLTMQVLIDRGYDPLAYRYVCLNAHYRQQLAFTWEALDAAASALARLKRIVLDLRGDCKGDEQPIASYMSDFRAAVEDDLNMPRALAAMWGATKDANAAKGEIYATLLAMDDVLGFGFAEMRSDGQTGAVVAGVFPDEFESILSREKDIPKLRMDGNFLTDLENMIRLRMEAKRRRDFELADKIRDQLRKKGITLEDTSEGTVWRGSQPPLTQKE